MSTGRTMMEKPIQMKSDENGVLCPQCGCPIVDPRLAELKAESDELSTKCAELEQQVHDVYKMRKTQLRDEVIADLKAEHGET